MQCAVQRRAPKPACEEGCQVEDSGAGGGQVRGRAGAKDEKEGA